MSFGRRIRWLREHRIGNLQELAALAHISWHTLIRIESDRHFPTLSELERLLDALGVRFDDVFRLIQDSDENSSSSWSCSAENE